MPLIKLLTRYFFGSVAKWNVTLLRLSVVLTTSTSSISLGDYDPAPFLSWIEETKTSVDIPGVAVAIVNRDEVLHLETWGRRSVDKEPLVTSNSLFRIASMSKTFAGAAATLVVDTKQQ